MFLCSQLCVVFGLCIVLFFMQKTADEMRISDCSSDVCSSDLQRHDERQHHQAEHDTCVESVHRSPQDSRPRQIIIEQRAEISDTSSAERRVGNEWVSTCRSRGSPYN